jgi:hypothetical protein
MPGQDDVILSRVDMVRSALSPVRLGGSRKGQRVEGGDAYLAAGPSPGSCAACPAGQRPVFTVRSGMPTRQRECQRDQEPDTTLAAQPFAG